MPILPSDTKETVFQALNRTMWAQNKAFKSGMVMDAKCLRYGCYNYIAKILELRLLNDSGDFRT